MADVFRGRVRAVTVEGIIVAVDQFDGGYVTSPLPRIAGPPLNVGDLVAVARVGRYANDLIVLGVLTRSNFAADPLVLLNRTVHPTVPTGNAILYVHDGVLNLLRSGDPAPI